MNDERCDLLCAYLSAALPVRLAANALFGYGWAYPVTELVIAGVAVKEGPESWLGESCFTAPRLTESDNDGSCDDGR
jgi:hypothetical protein